jgi:hypothetical protein
MRSTLNWILNHWLIQDKFWIALGSLVTASALVYTITKDRRNHSKNIYNLRKSLEIELVTNIDSIFSGGVDRPLLLDSIRTLRRSYIGDVKDREVLGELQRLYIELEHYQNFVKKFYLTDSGIDRRFVTEKQLQTENVFLKYFGHKEIKYNLGKLQHPDIGNGYIEMERNKAVKVKERNLDKWFEIIKDKVSKLI